jgi:hypothetical protein
METDILKVAVAGEVTTTLVVAPGKGNAKS